MNHLRLSPANAAILLCDIQERFSASPAHPIPPLPPLSCRSCTGPKIAHFDHLEHMAEKLLKAAAALHVPVLATEQNPKALGPTVARLAQLVPPDKTFPKTQFSMLVPELAATLANPAPKHVALVGIEAHICVLQTALDLLARGIHVHVLADAVSSCNAPERALAFQTIRAAGGTVSTTEAFIYRLLADASHPRAKDIFAIVKEYSEATRDALSALGAA
ncbi:hypothetical protein PtA15_16A68 [Puccinia triticina]|nr:uncharacterized protein PtA15_16A68 [Puccinia triticina]WAQ92162.1 hypothetical protein PtA15_16A68 [Puccinia triticina]WAR63903.1 hypothetical protein PtB15_16B62 [Puccinia triticina]